MPAQFDNPRTSRSTRRRPRSRSSRRPRAGSTRSSPASARAAPSRAPGRCSRRRSRASRSWRSSPPTRRVLSGQAAQRPNRIQGISAGFVPAIYDKKVVDQIVVVSYETATRGLAAALPRRRHLRRHLRRRRLPGRDPGRQGARPEQARRRAAARPRRALPLPRAVHRPRHDRPASSTRRRKIFPRRRRRPRRPERAPELAPHSSIGVPANADYDDGDPGAAPPWRRMTVTSRFKESDDEVRIRAIAALPCSRSARGACGPDLRQRAVRDPSRARGRRARCQRAADRRSGWPSYMGHAVDATALGSPTISPCPAARPGQS